MKMSVRKNRAVAGFRMSTSSAEFTLIEMLVVVAIIGILASMLMPTLQQSLESARSVMCTNNLKQISLISTQYSEAYNGYLPPNVRSAGAVYWADNLYALYANKTPGNKIVFRTGDWSSTNASVPRSPFDCPTSVPDIGANIRLSIDYTINIHMTAGYGRASRTRKPSSRGVFFDGYREINNPDQGTTPTAAVAYNALTLPENINAWRHNGSVNVAWYDGHVTTQNYGTIPTTTGDPAIYPERYFWGEGDYNGQPGRAP